MNRTRVAIVLFNLGGPDSPAAIAPFLKNFFMDPLIVRGPFLLRFLLSRLIAFKRSRNEAGRSYAALGGSSPLLANSQKQAESLQNTLNPDARHEYKCFVSMRYWHPMSDEIAQQVKSWNPDKIVLLPLYPQYSTTTTESSFRAWDAACTAISLQKPTARICCYPDDRGFIEQSARAVRAAYDETSMKSGMKPRVLFSAHGLPENIVRAGDPYQWQCEHGAKMIAKAANIDDSAWSICYQSRVGRLKWIGPSTEDEIQRAGRDGVPLVVYPHAFVNEHVETIVEIGEEYRHLAQECGVPHFTRVETVGTGIDFINGLAALVRELAAREGTFSGQGGRICPHSFSACRFGADNKERIAA